MKMNGHMVRIVRDGSRTQLWVDGEEIGKEVTSFTLRQDGAANPVLEIVKEYPISRMDVRLDSVKIVEEK